MRIGQGIDIHRFAENGNGFILGGVNIAYHKSIVAHSDGDVLLHAICDALLGALALGDIGKHFPDTDAKFSNVDSRLLLRKTFDLITQQSFILGNLDATIIAQEPKMSYYIHNMRTNIASDLNCNLNQISIKATTSEHIGCIGRLEGIMVMANVLLQPL